MRSQTFRVRQIYLMNKGHTPWMWHSSKSLFRRSARQRQWIYCCRLCALLAKRLETSQPSLRNHSAVRFACVDNRSMIHHRLPVKKFCPAALPILMQ